MNSLCLNWPNYILNGNFKHLFFYHNRKKLYFRLWFRVLQPIFSFFRLCFGYRVKQPITDTINDFFRVRVSVSVQLSQPYSAIGCMSARYNLTLVFMLTRFFSHVLCSSAIALRASAVLIWMSWLQSVLADIVTSRYFKFTTYLKL